MLRPSSCTTASHDTNIVVLFPYFPSVPLVCRFHAPHQVPSTCLTERLTTFQCSGCHSALLRFIVLISLLCRLSQLSMYCFACHASQVTVMLHVGDAPRCPAQVVARHYCISWSPNCPCASSHIFGVTDIHFTWMLVTRDAPRCSGVFASPPSCPCAASPLLRNTTNIILSI